MSLTDLKILKGKILFFPIIQCRKIAQEFQHQIQYCTSLYIYLTKFILLAQVPEQIHFSYKSCTTTDLQRWYFSVKKGGERLKIHMWFSKLSISTGIFFFMSRCFTWICNLTVWSCDVFVMVTSCKNSSEDSPAQVLWLSCGADFPDLQRFFYMVTRTVSVIFNEIAVILETYVWHIYR